MTREAYLVHNGVKGMKWGVRKSRQSRISAKVGYTDLARSNSKKHFQENNVKTLKFGNLLTSTEWQQSDKVKAGAEAAEKLLESVGSKSFAPTKVAYKDNTKFKKDPSLSQDMDLFTLKRKVVDPVNPEYGKLGTMDNCIRATYAYELRRRGYDVKATKSFGTDQNLVSEYNAITRGKQYLNTSTKHVLDLESKATNKETDVFVLGKEISYRLSNPKGLFNALSKQPPGSRGNVHIQFAPGGLHSAAYEVSKTGIPMVIDAQRGAIFQKASDMRTYNIPIAATSFIRLDDKALNMNQVSKWVTNA